MASVGSAKVVSGFPSLLLAGTAIAVLLMAGSALAADQAVKPRMLTKAPIIPVFTWTGFYLGANGGGQWGADSITTTTVAGFSSTAAAAIDAGSPVKLKPTGWLAGGQIGYNIQVNYVVLGLEGDADAMGGSASRSLVFAGPVPTAGDTLSNSTEGTFLATLRPRFGLALDHALFYVTGGVAIGTVKTTDSMSTLGGSLLDSVTKNATRVGWAAGGGFEYAFVDNWSVKVEGLHVDLGGTYDTGIPDPTLTGVSDIIVHHRYTDDIARIGINYHFGAAPVIAKY